MEVGEKDNGQVPYLFVGVERRFYWTVKLYIACFDIQFQGDWVFIGELGEQVSRDASEINSIAGITYSVVC